MENIKKSLYDTFMESYKNWENNIAINYFGNKISYKKLNENIEKLTNALVSNGVKKGDIVSVCTVGTPEFVYLLFALNKIGVIPSMIYPTATEKEIEESIKRTNSKTLFVIEDMEVCKKIKKATKNIDIKTVVIPPTNSLIAPLNLAIGVKDFFNKHSVKNEVLKNQKNVIKYNKYLKNQKIKSEKVAYEENSVAILHPTGGSTGPSKEVMITNENVNALVDNYQMSGLTFKPGEVVLDVLVPFVAYGSALLYKTLIEGATLVQIPVFNPKELGKNFKKYKPNHFSGVPTYFESLMEDPIMKDEMMEYCFTLAAGGDGILREPHERINSFLAQHKSACDKLLIGYGMTENYTTIATNLRDSYMLDTVGVPLGDNEVVIYDTVTGKKLQDGEVGEICVSGRTVAKGYYKNEEETKKTFVKHNNGKIYLHTGDLGHFIEEDGKKFLVFDGRIKNMIVRSGYKVYPSIVENEIMTNENVKDCCVVSTYDKIDKHAPKAHVILKEGSNEEVAKKMIFEMYNQNNDNHFPEYHKPVDIKVRESMPLTKMRKVNRLVLGIEDIISSHPYVNEANVTVNEDTNVDYTFDVLVSPMININLDDINSELMSYCLNRFEEEKIRPGSIKFNMILSNNYSDAAYSSNINIGKSKVKEM